MPQSSQQASAKDEPRQGSSEAEAAAPATRSEQTPRCAGVVGIGASAGGLEPLQEFFDHATSSDGLAYVVIQHLSPDYKSLMQELLARHTSMPIHRVEDGMHVVPDAIYLIPPKKNMVIDGEQLRLIEQEHERGQGPNFPINLFFESLATHYGERAIGVVLSGTGSDGSRGVRAINEAGGLVLVQDPETAQFDGMPQSAIATNQVHCVIPPTEMAQQIHDYATRSVAGVDLPGFQTRHVGNENLARITQLLKQDGVDFSHYKPTTLGRRVERRMLINHCADIEDYLQRLEQSEDERLALRRDLLISVTSFMRDPEAWHYLETQTLPDLIRQLPPDEPLRVWVTACATGEEVYTLVMLLYEQFEKQQRTPTVKVFATDIDTEALEKAAAATYPASIVEDIGNARAARFFERKGDRYQLNRPVREKVIFANHDLTRDAPFTKIHLVLCRNVLIYMQPELQSQVLAMLHFSLSSKGILFLGAAENLGDLQAEFRTVHQKFKVFEKRRDVPLPLSRGRRVSGLVDPVGIRPAGAPATAEKQVETAAVAAFGTYLRDRDAVALVVAPDQTLTHVFGRSGAYLQMPQGEQTMDLLRLLPKALSLSLNTALHRLKKSSDPILFSGVKLGDADDARHVDMRVMPQKSAKGMTDGALVIIEPSTAAHSVAAARTFDVESEAAQHIRTLEEELQQTKENLQATIEELETTNEEQQASNEELLASNEELQSTNEELHSVNEELHTVNAEYQAKIRELTDLNNDMDNLLRSTDIGTVFVDGELRIRKFTPAIMRIINLMDHDVGRPIDHISSNFGRVDLPVRVRAVLRAGEPSETNVQLADGTALLMRIHPYRTDEGRLDGAVLTFVDVTDLKRAREKLEEQKQALEQMNRRLARLAAIVESSEDAIISKTPDGTITSWNAGAERLYGFSAQEAVGQNVRLIIPPEQEGQAHELMAQAQGGRESEPIETVRRHKDGHLMHVSINMFPVKDNDGNVLALATISRNITARKEAEEERDRLTQALQQTAEALRERNVALEQASAEMESFVYSASHDLRAPLLNLQGFTDRLSDSIERVQAALREMAGEDAQKAQAVQRMLDDSVTGALRHIHTSVHKFRRVIDGLLRLSRTGRQELRIQPVNMKLLAENVVSEFAEMIRRRGVTVQVHNLPPAEADPDAANRILANLVSNALNYLVPDRPGQIEIGARATNDGRVMYFVRDNGVGISPRHHEKIFRMFERLDPAGSDGDGLGLTIAQKLVDRHGGELSLVSDEGEGSTFCFTLCPPGLSAAASQQENAP